jgi:hypothetical protein
MPRTVPTVSAQSPNNPITSALWNTQVEALANWSTRPVIFCYWQNTTAQSLPNNAATALAFDTPAADSESCWSSATPSRFNCQVAGWYSISGSAVFAANATGARTAQIAVNGAAVPYGLGQAAAAASVRTAVSAEAIYHLNVGDYVEVWATQSSGAALNTAQGSVLNVNWISL